MGAGDPNHRREVWLDVLRFAAPVDVLEERVAALGWSDGPEVATLENAHIVHTLERYLEGAIDAESVARWASLLEMRDELQFGDGSDETMLPDVLFELATPEINHALTGESAIRLIASLTAPPAAG